MSTCGIKNTSVWGGGGVGESKRQIKKNFLLQLFCLSAAKHSFTLPHTDTRHELMAGWIGLSNHPHTHTHKSTHKHTHKYFRKASQADREKDTNPLLYFQLSIVVAISLPVCPPAHFVGVGIIIKVY